MKIPLFPVIGQNLSPTDMQSANGHWMIIVWLQCFLSYLLLQLLILTVGLWKQALRRIKKMLILVYISPPMWNKKSRMGDLISKNQNQNIWMSRFFFTDIVNFTQLTNWENESKGCFSAVIWISIYYGWS